MNLLLLSGSAVAGFFWGFVFTWLYFRRRAGNFERILRKWGHRTHSLRVNPGRFKIMKRPRYRINPRQFRLDSRSSRDW